MNFMNLALLLHVLKISHTITFSHEYLNIDCSYFSYFLISAWQCSTMFLSSGQISASMFL